MSFSSFRALLTDTVWQWFNANAQRLGASLAFYTMFSMAPLLVVVVGIAGVAFGREAAEGQIVWQMRDLVGEQGAEVAQTMLARIDQPAAGVTATGIGFLVLLFGSSAVFAELRSTLNTVWGVQTPAGAGLTGMVRDRAFSAAMVMAIGFLLLVSLVVNAALSATGAHMGHLLPLPEAVLQALNTAVSLVVITGLFAALYKVVPDVRIAWRDVITGAFVTALLFSVGKLLIGLYLGKASIGSAYGAAGSVVVLLMWVYYSAQVFFLGAVFTRLYAERYGSRAPRRKSKRPPAGQPRAA
jgi:membrane protein